VQDTEVAECPTERLSLRFSTLQRVTFVDCQLPGADFYGAVSNDWNLQAGAVSFVDNIFVPAPGTNYVGGSVGFGADGKATWASDLWFGGHDGVPSFASAARTGDPKFVAAGTDYHLGSGSGAIGTGSAAVSPLVVVDLDGRTRASPWDIGAYAASATH